MRKKLLLSIVLFSFPLILFAATVIPLRSLDLPPKIFQITSEYYQISPNVEEIKEPGFLKFHINSSHAPYDVEGMFPFKKLLSEVEVIERIKRNEEGTGFVEGAVDSVKDTGKGFVNLVVHPIDSIGGMGKAAGKLGRNIGGAFRSKEQGEKTTFGEKFLGSSEREIANQFGVDVYTTNPYLQELLKGMARSRLGGKGAAMIGKIFIPGGIIVSATLSASGVNSAADQYVNDKSRGELFRLNRQALMEMGFGEQEVKNLLNSSYYSPREMTYLRFYIEKLKDVKGSREIMRTAVGAKSLWEARKILYEAQMAADALGEKSHFDRIRCFKEGLAFEESKRAVFVTPYDYLDHSSLGDAVMSRALEVKKIWSKDSVEIWNASKVTAGFTGQAILKGIKTRSWVLFSP